MSNHIGRTGPPGPAGRVATLNDRTRRSWESAVPKTKATSNSSAVGFKPSLPRLQARPFGASEHDRRFTDDISALQRRDAHEAARRLAEASDRLGVRGIVETIVFEAARLGPRLVW